MWFVLKTFCQKYRKAFDTVKYNKLSKMLQNLIIDKSVGMGQDIKKSDLNISIYYTPLKYVIIHGNLL